MNKIVKSSGKWRSLPRRVSPVLNFMQALLAVAVVILLISTLKYRKSGENTSTKGVWNSAVIYDFHPLGRVSGELDPAAFLNDHPGRHALPAVVPAADTLPFKVIRPDIKPGTVVVPEFEKFEVTDMPVSADMSVNSINEYPAVKLPENNSHAVMYNESGREISRWQFKKYGVNAPTLFRVDGEGVLQYFSLIGSSGDAEADKLALQTAQKMQLSSGLYTVYYPRNITAQKGM